ncbi:MAG: orotidine-5'-phosphate decarboxylase [Bacteroidales bacterium]|nr:orotidine-5'-phosphate decarboxylase [Bacteroidales bacterium]
MTRQELINLIRERQSFLCVGLDTDPDKLPAHLKGQPDAVFQFNRAIIDATIDLCVAYKPNLAFYEALGIEGLRQLQLTMRYLHSLGKPAFTIADAKRGDIGNTSERYARAFLGPESDFGFDAMTIAPYMGSDSVTPFTVYPGKWVILLALTSNKGAQDFQLTTDANGTPLYQRVLQASRQWGTDDNMMYVVGATQAEMLADVRRTVPGAFLLVPGVGAQGGSLDQVCRFGINADCGLLVNASRSIIYASQGTDFADAARNEALKLQQQMAQHLKNINL